MTLARLLQRGFRHAGLSVRRAGAEHRFDATWAVLEGLARRGYAPEVVVDVGANVGRWTTRARAVFPGAAIHAIEPQPALQARLEAAARAAGRVTMHRVAVTAPGPAVVRLAGTGEGDSSGAWVADDGHGVAVPASTLDALLEPAALPDGILVKLDVEGHELRVLDGASLVLARAAFVLCEVTFYDVEAAGHPLLRDVVARMDALGFELFDIVALAGRPRDGRLRSGDVLFVSRAHPFARDVAWA